MSCLTGDLVSASVKAEEEVSTLSMTRAGILLLIDSSPIFRTHIIEEMVKRIQKSNDRVMEEHTKSLLIIKQNETEDQHRYGELVGNSSQTKELIREVERLSKIDGVIYIQGEPGVGKAHVARRIHYHSSKESDPLLTASGSDFDLNSWDMKVRAAKGGTIVLNQAELLPAEIINQIINSSHETRLIITGTDLPGVKFDNQLIIAPLRERSEDIPLLACHFLRKSGAVDPDEVISQEALRMLGLYPFLTNNVEELMSVVQEAYILSKGKTIYSNHLRFGRQRAPGTRPTIGLALGSGSTRGTAHVGVLKVLEQENIPIDMISGTSVGSLVGGAYAAGLPLADFEKIITTIRWKQLVRFTFPRLSFVHNDPMVGFIESYIGQKNFEDLNIPFAAVASDANTGEAHIMRTGSVARAICASTAIPAVMRPVNYQGKTLVDGAVVHPVPVALVKSMGADIVIAVNVCDDSYMKGSAKNFISSILNTIDIMSAKIVKEELQLADVILRPELGYNQIGFKDAPLNILAGEKVTREAIAAIRGKVDSFI